MRPVLVGITGYAQVGKDTSAAFLRNVYKYNRCAFADALREMARDIDPIIDVQCGDTAVFADRFNDVEFFRGYEGAKAAVPGFREFLKRLGAAGREHLGVDVWAQAALKNVQPYTVVSDVRFLNEAVAIREAAERLGGDALIIRVTRPDHGPESDFELGVDLIPHDYVVANDGAVTDLYNKLAEVMRLASGEGDE
ncbi:MAG: hypothetical protein WC822_05925 [Candidatus Paceibacterota bacterium]|jgi:hypothetical protein